MDIEDVRLQLEILSYVVTVVGFPFAIWVFVLEKRKQALTEDEEIYQRLSDEYAEFQRLVLEHVDLHLLQDKAAEGLDDAQREKRHIIFDILISLFERAYLLTYEKSMNRQRRRLWGSWEDYMREWCRRQDFLALLPDLMRGEDPEFTEYILNLAQAENPGWTPPAAGPADGAR